MCLALFSWKKTLCLGLFVAERRSLRLVVDSTISGVTQNTLIPNKLLLPKIAEVRRAGQETSASSSILAFSLDVLKGSRRIKIADSDGGSLRLGYHDPFLLSCTLNLRH